MNLIRQHNPNLDVDVLLDNATERDAEEDTTEYSKELFYSMIEAVPKDKIIKLIWEGITDDLNAYLTVDHRYA